MSKQISLAIVDLDPPPEILDPRARRDGWTRTEVACYRANEALVNLRAVAGAVVKLVARYEALKFCDDRPGATMDDPEVDEIEKRIFASTFQTSNDRFTVTIEPTKRQNEIVDGD